MPPKPAEDEDWLVQMGYRIRIQKEKRRHRLYKEFLKGQGRLLCDREVSFVCLDGVATDTMMKTFNSPYHAVQLNSIHIPWNSGYGQGTRLDRPFALVWGPQAPPGFSSSTWSERALGKLGLASLPESGFPRSLLAQGTIPIPETLRDWVMGIPGESAALPYFASAAEENDEEECCQYQLVLRLYL